MKVIIVVGSKHDSTRSIAETVGDALRNGDLEVSVVRPLSRRTATMAPT